MVKVFETDFTNAKIVGSTLYVNNIAIAGFLHGGTASEAIIDDPTARAGKSLHMIVTSAGVTDRNELRVVPSRRWGLTGKYGIEVHMRMSPIFELPADVGWQTPHDLSDEYLNSSTMYMKITAPVLEASTDGLAHATLRGRKPPAIGQPDATIWAAPYQTVDYEILRNWFTIKSYVEPHLTDGVAELSLEGYSWSMTNVPTTLGLNPNPSVAVAKLYGPCIGKELWVDYIAFYDDRPDASECPEGWHYDPVVQGCVLNERVTLNIAITGNGSTEPAAGTYEYGKGENVPISATAAEGSKFVKWKVTKEVTPI